MVEFWTTSMGLPPVVVKAATRAEAQGWDGIGAGDSQSLTGDPYVFLALAATASDTLGLATSVTNPVTRHAAATASPRPRDENRRFFRASVAGLPVTGLTIRPSLHGVAFRVRPSKATGPAGG